jgi:hypothetical protein
VAFNPFCKGLSQHQSTRVEEVGIFDGDFKSSHA